MIFINPWWMYIFAGTKLEDINFNVLSKKDWLKIGVYTVILITIIVLFFRWFFPWVLALAPKIGGLLSIIIVIIGVILLVTILLFLAIKVFF